jgi:hypothetical protein
MRPCESVVCRVIYERPSRCGQRRTMCLCWQPMVGVRANPWSWPCARLIWRSFADCSGHPLSLFLPRLGNRRLDSLPDDPVHSTSIGEEAVQDAHRARDDGAALSAWEAHGTVNVPSRSNPLFINHGNETGNSWLHSFAQALRILFLSVVVK